MKLKGNGEVLKQTFEGKYSPKRSLKKGRVSKDKIFVLYFFTSELLALALSLSYMFFSSVTF